MGLRLGRWFILGEVAAPVVSVVTSRDINTYEAVNTDTGGSKEVPLRLRWHSKGLLHRASLAWTGRSVGSGQLKMSVW